MSCLPCASFQPEHKLLAACYPDATRQPAPGAVPRASTEDVQRLVDFGNARPAKLGTIAGELEKRVIKDAGKATSGQAKNRATLLVSLDIFRRLITGCKSELARFVRSTLRAVSAALDVRTAPRGAYDVDVLSRAAQAFAAFAGFTDGAGVGADSGDLTYVYTAALAKLAKLATYEGDGGEKTGAAQARVRAVGLAGLGAAAASDALFAGTAEAFARQAAAIVPPILLNVAAAPLDMARTESARLGADTSPFHASAAAAAARRASTAGEKAGGEPADVLGAALRALHALASQSQLEQTSLLLRAVLTWLDESALWNRVDFCAWLGERLAVLTQLQYRFIIPKHLSELILGLADAVPPTTKQMAVADMLSAILSSSVSVVGLSIPELLDHVLALVIRRARIGSRDALLPPLVRVIAATPAHIYYADQISDAVEEIAGRIALVPVDDLDRQETIRVLVCCTQALLSAATDADARAKPSESFFDQPAPAPSRAPFAGKGKAPQIGTPLPTPLETPWRAVRRRNPVAPEVWQGTLPLLCEATFPLRAAYARALLWYIEHELPREPLRGPAPAGPDARVLRFCHALNAALYTLAMSSALGPEPDLETSGPVASQASANETAAVKPNGDAAANGASTTTAGSDNAAATVANGSAPVAGDSPAGTPPRKDSAKGVTFNLIEPTPADSEAGTPGGDTAATVKRRASRRVSLPLNRLNSAVRLPSPDAVATPYDYAFFVRVLYALHAAAPAAALLATAPMLLALDRDAGNELVRRAGDGRAGAYVLERKRAAREAVAVCWRRIAGRWGAAGAAELAARALADMPEPFVLPPDAPPVPLRVLPDGALDPGAALVPPPDEVIIFSRIELEGETSATSRPLLDPAAVVDGVAGARTAQTSTALGPAELAARLGAPWSVDGAIRDSVEREADDDDDAAPRPSGASFLSAARPLSRAQVSVEDLREALGGRQDAPSAASSFVSSPAHARAAALGTPARRADVKEVLRDIFAGQAGRGGQGGQDGQGASAAGASAAGVAVDSNGVAA